MGQKGIRTCKDTGCVYVRVNMPHCNLPCFAFQSPCSPSPPTIALSNARHYLKRPCKGYRGGGWSNTEVKNVGHVLKEKITIKHSVFFQARSMNAYGSRTSQKMVSAKLRSYEYFILEKKYFDKSTHSREKSSDILIPFLTYV